MPTREAALAELNRVFAMIAFWLSTLLPSQSRLEEINIFTLLGVMGTTGEHCLLTMRNDGQVQNSGPRSAAHYGGARLRIIRG
jgi:hypothetical protein